MSADRVAFAIALLLGVGTAAFAFTRTICPKCRVRYSNWRTLQHHIRLAHRD